MRLTGNTILITGGTSGIGLGLALRLRDAGNDVIVAGRRTDLLESISAEHEGISALRLDVTDPDSISAAAEELARTHPRLNVLINNAGIMLPEDLSGDDWLEVSERTVSTNLLGTLRMTAALLPRLREREHAAILNVTSGLAFVPLPATPTYSATKAALHSFSESLRVQLRGTPVEVHEIAPPGVRTTLMNQQEAEWAMPLEEFLDEVMSLLTADPGAPEVLVGQVRPIRYAAAEGTYAEHLEHLTKMVG
ncbi:SDR family NAD(P)-dependent oxidoreductase [Streptomyces sp. AJS327]|uniref:SDR family oxidoreductase n=1 Tax=Streptomyces sp. AJS327 TaxID=2545265 RepID=UPI0015DDC8B3|nr:SDR family NAD(P)-dependent oxidoreductase [Streptomyces sp. AJS327]MBA0051247.1 SDR family NAD(P)-dependent oxidoreductase [Streptomyces sp. AJS327]